LFHRKIAEPVAKLLKQGITPEKIALSFACGVVLGLFPVVGTTTVLCLVIGMVLRLNPVAIQIFNWFVYPLQLILLVPFFKFGAFLFRVELAIPGLDELKVMFDTDLWGTVALLWGTIWHAIVGWLLLAPVAVTGLYFIALPMLRKMEKRG